MASNLFALLNEETRQRLKDSGGEMTGEGENIRLEAPASRLLDIMSLLKSEAACNYLADITAVDRGDAGFEVVYQLFALEKQAKGTVKTVALRDNPRVPSVTALWPGADWMEREAFDLMGVVFENHPCLERILLCEEFNGHPLRKDFRMQPLA